MNPEIIKDYQECTISVDELCRKHGTTKAVLNRELTKLGLLDVKRTHYYYYKKTVQTVLDMKKGLNPEADKRLNGKMIDYGILIDKLRTDSISLVDFVHKKRIMSRAINRLYSHASKKKSDEMAAYIRDRRAYFKDNGLTYIETYGILSRNRMEELRAEAKEVNKKKGLSPKLRKIIYGRVSRLNSMLKKPEDHVPGLYNECTTKQVKMMEDNLKKPDSFFSGTGGSLHNNDAFVYCTDGGW